MEGPRPVGVEIEDLYVVILLWFEFLIEGIGHPGGLAPGFVSQGKDDNLGKGHPARRVGHDAPTDIDDAFNDPVIGLIGGDQGAGREKRGLDPAVGPLFQLFAPLIGQLGDGMGGRHKTGILQLEHRFCGKSRNSETNQQHHGKKKFYYMILHLKSPPFCNNFAFY